MKRNVSSSSHRDDKSTTKTSRSEDSRDEEERLRRRREWMIQQEREREHERLKKKMILEYEIRRARAKGLPVPKGRLIQRSRSGSPETHHRRNTAKNTPKVPMMSEKLKSSDGTSPLFKGPEGTQISVTELRRIKVDIHRNIPEQTTTDELQREILNSEDLILKRRAGEGSKPIFEREEIKGTGGTSEEIEEHRTVVAVNNENLDTKSKVSSKYKNPIRTHSRSPLYTTPTSSSRHKSKEYKDGDRRHSESRDVDDHLRDRKCHRNSSRSRGRELTKSDRDSYRRSFKDERSYSEYRERSRGRLRDRSRERRERDRSRDRRLPPAHYIEQIPVPIYCGNFPPRPIMVGPLPPIRGQVPLGGSRHLPIMGPIRPFPPQFIPQDIYRLRPGPNPRFGPMY